MKKVQLTTVPTGGHRHRLKSWSSRLRAKRRPNLSVRLAGKQEVLHWRLCVCFQRKSDRVSAFYIKIFSSGTSRVVPLPVHRAERMESAPPAVLQRNAARTTRPASAAVSICPSIQPSFQSQTGSQRASKPRYPPGQPPKHTESVPSRTDL